MKRIKKISLLLLISIFFSCSNTESDDQIDNIDTIDDIKFVSQIVFQDSLMNEVGRWSFNYDQYNRIINGNRTNNQGVTFPLFIVSYLINDVSNIMISTSANTNEYSYDITFTDSIINIIDINNEESVIRKIHLTNNFIDKIAYHNNENQFIYSSDFERNNNDDLTLIASDTGHLPTVFSNYEPSNDKRPDPMSFIIGESLEIDLLILIYNLKISKNTPRKSLSIDNGMDTRKNHTLSYDDDGFLTSLHWDFIRGGFGEVDYENSGTRIYSYVEN
jgi:hypothetical protein